MMMNDQDMKEKVLQEIMDLMDQKQGEDMKKPKIMAASIEVKKDPMMDEASDPDQDKKAMLGSLMGKSMMDPDSDQDAMEMSKGLPDSDAKGMDDSSMDNLDWNKIGDNDKLTPEMVAKLVSMMKK